MISFVVVTVVLVTISPTREEEEQERDGVGVGDDVTVVTVVTVVLHSDDVGRPQFSPQSRLAPVIRLTHSSFRILNMLHQDRAQSTR